MQKAVITGERQAGLVEVPDPQPKRNWAVVKVHVAPMCTEYKAFLGGWKSEFLGHEAAGEVVAVAQPGRVKVGDRVVVMPQYPCGSCPLCVAGDYIHCESGPDFTALNGSPEGSATMAQHLLKPDWLLPAIPDDLSYEHASLACCALGPSFGAFDRMGLDAFDTVLIAGAGPVGLGAVVNAAFRGARVAVLETHPWRTVRARELGADLVLDPADPDALRKAREWSGGAGVDRALDCTGAPPAQRFCIDAARRMGKVAFVGECYEEDLKLRVSPDMIRKGLTLHGSWHYNLSLYPDILQVVRRSPVVDRLVSHVLPLRRIQDALELAASHDCAKILLKPWE